MTAIDNLYLTVYWMCFRTKTWVEVHQVPFTTTHCSSYPAVWMVGKLFLSGWRKLSSVVPQDDQGTHQQQARLATSSLQNQRTKLCPQACYRRNRYVCKVCNHVSYECSRQAVVYCCLCLRLYVPN